MIRWEVALLFGSLGWLGCCPATQPPQPPPPIAVQQAAKAVLRGYVHDVAHNFHQLSKENFNTVTEAMQRNVELDHQARERYAQALKSLLEPKLGSEAFPHDGHQLFSDMASGFAEVSP
jgi:hypothetical protein